MKDMTFTSIEIIKKILLNDTYHCHLISKEKKKKINQFRIYEL